MNTTTQLANYALALIGQAKISDIDDTGSPAARAAKEFMQPTIDESLRLHRWNCAIKRATLTQTDPEPVHGLDYSYQLPSDFLRLLEVNGEQWEDTDEFHEIEGRRLVTDEDTVEIRYISRIEVASMDPLLAKFVAANLAGTLAIPLTANLQLQQQVMAIRQRVLGEARSVDAIETSSREGRPLERVIHQSRLLRSRYSGHSLRRLHNRFPSW